jgi:pilus assembly protein CpaC
MKIVRTALSLLVAAAFVLGGIPHSSSGVYAFTGENSYNEIQVLKGDIETIPTSNLKRVSITDPVIADINDARAKAVEIIGLEEGQTGLFIWDDQGKRTVVIRVVTENLDLVQRRIQSLLESAGITGLEITENNYEGKIVVSGSVPEGKADVLKTVLEPLGARVINLTQKEKIEDLVQIDMQVTELSTLLTKALGIDWMTGTQTADGTGGYTTDTNGQFTPTAGEVLPSQDGSVGDMFKVGKLYRMTNSALVAKVNAMITEGKGKILSKPRLVVVSGKEATVQVGGQVPLKSSTVGTTGSSTETITFKDYGITMAITPTIENGNMVNILLNITISDVDTASYVNTSSSGSVAFLTRSAQTQIVLEDRQTIVLAGMIKRRTGETNKRVPLLGSIPVLGMLFRSKNVPADSETEVVISVTPTILRTARERSQARKAIVEKPLIQDEPVAPRPLPPAANPVIRKVVDIPAAVSAPVVLTPGTGSEGYAKSVQQKIMSAIAYPYEAQEKSWEGTVKLTLVLQKDGTLKSVVVKESSGQELFDQDALNTAQILAPYAAFPSDVEAEEMTVTIPIVYSLDGFLKNVAAQ